MSFLHPILLGLGLASVAAPILIHLLMRRRRRPVRWGAMRFLQEAYRQQRRRLRLEQFLLLATRCLLLACLALGIAHPLLGSRERAGDRVARTLYLMIDTSLASGLASGLAEGTGGGAGAGASGRSALEAHLAQARALLAQLDEGRADRVGVIALGAPARAVVLPASGDLAGVARAIDALRSSSGAMDLTGGAMLLRDALTQDAGAGNAPRASSRSTPRVAVLSEFRAGSADVTRALPALLAPRAGAGDGPGGVAGGGAPVLAASAPATDAPDNASVVRVEPLDPLVLSGGAGGGAADAPVRARVTLRRSGAWVGRDAVSAVRVALVGAGVQATALGEGRAELAWSRGQSEQSVDVEVSRGRERGAPGAAQVLIASIDRDALAGDDAASRPLTTRERLVVAIVAPRSDAVRAAAAGASPLERFAPGDWLRLAIDPGQDLALDAELATAQGDVRLVWVDPARAGDAPLAGVDAAFVLAPDALEPSGWAALRALADAGGMVAVFPPAGARAHAWGASFAEAMGVEWSIAAQGAEFPDAPLRPAARRATPPTLDLLAGVAGELDALTPAVSVRRALALSEAPPAQDVVLALSDGSPLLLAARPAAREGAARETAGQGAGADERAPGAGQSTGRGLVALFTVALDLEWTDLPAKPLMVALVQESLRQGVGRAPGAGATVAGAPPLLPPETAELTPVGGVLPGALSAAPGEGAGPRRAEAALAGLPDAGLWLARDERGRTLGPVAVNPDADAGRTDPNEPAQVAAWLGGLTGGGPGALRTLGAPNESPVGTPGGTEGAGTPLLDAADPPPSLALPFFAAALMLALVEVVLARVFSHARAGGGGAGGGAGGDAAAAPAGGGAGGGAA